jgi:hypothetical protein
LKNARTRLFLAHATAAGVSALCAILATATVTSMSTAAGPQSADQSALQAPTPGDEGPLVAEGQPADLAIIYTGGVVGYVEPCG